MELRLAQLANSVRQISDIENQDPVKPWVFNLPHPDPSNPLVFSFYASQIEPWYLGPPLNGIWVCLAPESPSYLKVLKLKGSEDPEISTVPNVIRKQGFLFSWIVINEYDNLFSEQQVALTGSSVGPQGAQGPQGIAHIGVWSSSTTYLRGNVVRFNGSSYVSLLSNNLNYNPSTSTTYWLLIAAIGDTPVIPYQALMDAAIAQLGWQAQTYIP